LTTICADKKVENSFAVKAGNQAVDLWQGWANLIYKAMNSSGGVD
jgi:hypothetical protein